MLTLDYQTQREIKRQRAAEESETESPAQDEAPVTQRKAVSAVTLMVPRGHKAEEMFFVLGHISRLKSFHSWLHLKITQMTLNLPR